MDKEDIEFMQGFNKICNWARFWFMEGLERRRIRRRMKREEVSILDKYIIMLLGVDDKPIPSLTHLKGMLILCAKIDPELQKYLDEHGGIKLP